MSIVNTRLIARLLGGATIAALCAGQAFAAGFEVKERSATAQGAANAGGTSAAEDVSYMAFNPAAIAFQSGFNVAVGASLLIPSAEFSNTSGTALGGGAIAGSGDTNDTLALVPSAYMSAQLSDSVYLGLGVNAPFGLVTDYEDDWVGRYHGTYSELLTINVSPTIAWRPIPEIAIAGGPVIEYVDATLENAVDFGALTVAGGGAPLAPPGSGFLDGPSKLEGDDIAFGWTIGAIIEPVKGTRIGASYRSEIEHQVDLDATILRPDGSTFYDDGARTTVSAPAQVNFGLTQELSPDWAVMFEAQWTQWSSFEDLTIDFNNTLPDNVTEENWDDTWFLSAGARHQMTEDLAVRFGVAYDTGAAPNEYRTPRIPDADRIWGSVGATYALTESMSLSGAYTYVHVVDSELELDGGGTNALRGSLNADVDSDVHILTVGATFKY